MWRVKRIEDFYWHIRARRIPAQLPVSFMQATYCDRQEEVIACAMHSAVMLNPQAEITQ